MKGNKDIFLKYIHYKAFRYHFPFSCAEQINFYRFRDLSAINICRSHYRCDLTERLF